MVGAAGFEPATPWSQARCSTKLSHAPSTTKYIIPILHWFVNNFIIAIIFDAPANTGDQIL